MNKQYIHQMVKRLQCSGKKRKEIKKQLTADYMAEVSQMGQHYATVQVTVSYENVNVMYTISFDEDGKLAGLWMK